MKMSILNKNQNNGKLLRKGDNREFDLNIANIANSVLSESKEKFLVLTGSDCGVGVSSIALALAESLSEFKKVLLIEANLIEPSYAANVIADNEKYFDDFLLKKADLKDTLTKINDNFDALIINNNCEDLATARINLTNGSLQERLSVIEGDYDIILVDTPNINAFDDAVNIAKIGRQIALVIQARTPRKHLKKAVNKIDIAKVNLLGVIINKKNSVNLYK